MIDVKQLASQTNRKRVRWGFIWAILCAVLWGLGYVPLDVVWYLEPFSTLAEGSMQDYILASIIIAFAQAFFFMLVIVFFWTLLTGKLRETVKTLRRPKISKWIFVGAVFGGPMAVLGTALAIGNIGAGFAAAISLLSAVVGTIAARIMYKEKLTRNSIAGLILLVVGGIVILDPSSVIDQMTSSSGGDSMLGYIGGIMAAVGFGLEGAFAAAAMDVTDADSSVAVKYITETLLWIVVLLPATAIWVGFDTFSDAFTTAFTNTSFIYWMIIAGFSLGMCYVTMYKCYPLLGVGRTQAVTALYVPVSIVALWAFRGQDPSMWVVAGTVIALAGLFAMIGDSKSLEGSTRGTSSAEEVSRWTFL